VWLPRDLAQPSRREKSDPPLDSPGPLVKMQRTGSVSACATRSPRLGRGIGMSTSARRQRITVEDIGDIAVVQFVDKKILDEQNIQMIGDDLFRLVDELGRRKILLNFSNVEFMSSAALGKLIRLHQRMTQVNGKLVLCSIIDSILTVFKLTKLDKMLKIVKDEQTGLSSF
jgi:anti-sigma B factor antagonist